MPIVEFSERDIKRGTIVRPAWYRMLIEEVDADGTLSRDQKSTNYNIEGTILFEGDNGSTEFRGVPITWNFNSKALGFSKDLFKALGVEVKANERYRLEAAQGQQVDVYVENDTYQGRPVNRVNHKYRAIRPDVTAVEEEQQA